MDAEIRNTVKKRMRDFRGYTLRDLNRTVAHHLELQSKWEAESKRPGLPADHAADLYRRSQFHAEFAEQLTAKIRRRKPRA